MTLARIVVAALCLLPAQMGWSSQAGPNAGQSGPAQSAQPSSTTGNQQQKSSQPCSDMQRPDTSQSGSNAKSDCKATASKPAKKKPQAHSAQKPHDDGPSKKVVRDGGSGQPTVAISSAEDQKQASRIEETNRLLDAADNNLKDVAVRGLNASQEVTVKQIRSYMDEARAAASSGDVERAYNLANKANMLAADLNR